MDDMKKVTCLMVDEMAGMLWLGHEDGRISGFPLGPKPGTSINTRRQISWQAMPCPCHIRKSPI